MSNHLALRPHFQSHFPSSEEVGHCDRPDRGGVSLRGGGKLLWEALRPAAARLWPELQQPLDVLQAASQGVQTPPRLPQHPQAGGKKQTPL